MNWKVAITGALLVLTMGTTDSYRMQRVIIGHQSSDSMTVDHYACPNGDRPDTFACTGPVEFDGYVESCCSAHRTPPTLIFRVWNHWLRINAANKVIVHTTTFVSTNQGCKDFHPYEYEFSAGEVIEFFYDVGFSQATGGGNWQCALINADPKHRNQ
jgi:hypothetical protein